MNLTRAEYTQMLWEKYHKLNKDNIVERRCTACCEWLEENTDNFYLKNKSYPELGFSPECRKCTIKRTDKNRSEKYDDYYRDYNKQLYLKDPEKFKEHDKINVRSKPEQYKQKKKEWRQDHPEKCRDYSKLHRVHDITEVEWRSCLKVFGNTCAYCGLPLEKHIAMRNGRYIIMNFHKEHVDDKGYNDLRNAVPACQHCNSSKRQYSIEEWYFKQKFFSIDRYIKILWWINEEYKDYIEDKPPYRIVRKQNEDKKSFHWQLWVVDEYRNMIEYIHIGDKKKDIQKWIEVNKSELEEEFDWKL